MSGTWGAPASWEIVCRRASGRRRYNAQRAFLRNLRRAQLACRLAGVPASLRQAGKRSGLQALLAEEFGVSPATICRDLKALRSPSHFTRPQTSRGRLPV